MKAYQEDYFEPDTRKKIYSITCDRCWKEVFTSPFPKSWHRGTYLYFPTPIYCVECGKKETERANSEWKKMFWWEKVEAFLWGSGLITFLFIFGVLGIAYFSRWLKIEEIIVGGGTIMVLIYGFYGILGPIFKEMVNKKVV